MIPGARRMSNVTFEPMIVPRSMRDRLDRLAARSAPLTSRAHARRAALAEGLGSLEGYLAAAGPDAPSPIRPEARPRRGRPPAGEAAEPTVRQEPFAVDGELAARLESVVAAVTARWPSLETRSSVVREATLRGLDAAEARRGAG